MAISIKHKDTAFCVGDKVRVDQRVKEGSKERHQYFDGIVMAIKGRGSLATFRVRRIGEQQIGIEKIFPIASPSLVDVKVIKKGLRGIRRSKLYYIRDKSKKEVDKIYARAQKREVEADKK